MKWKFILFLMLGAMSTMFLVWLMPPASGDDPRQGAERKEFIDDEPFRADGDGPTEADPLAELNFLAQREPDVEADEAAEADDDEHAEPEKRLTKIVRLRKLQANRALEVLKMAGGRRRLAMGSDEATNSLILSGHPEDLELATEILRSLEEGGPEAVRKFVADLDQDRAGGEGLDLEGDTGPFKREVINIMEESEEDLEFWIGFPRDQDVEEMLARRMKELEEIENQAGEIQEDFVAETVRAGGNRNKRDAERVQRSMQQRLSEVVAKSFELRQQVQRLQVYRLRSRLADVTRKMDQREELRERIISQRIHQMTQEAERAAANRLNELRIGAGDNPENDDSPRAEGAADVLDFFDLTNDVPGDPGEDEVKASTVRVTWIFTEDFGRRTKQIHTSGTIVGEGRRDGATLVVTAAPTLPDEEPSSIIARWPGMNPHPAQIVATDRENGLLLLSTALPSRRALPFDTTPKAGMAIRATWVTDDGWADEAGVIAATARLAGKRKLIQHDIFTFGEAAGGPIVNRKGHIIGLLASPASAHGIYVAIPANVVQAFLKSAMSSQRAPRKISDDGAGLTPRIPDRSKVADAEVELLEIRRELVDVEHAFIAAEKLLSQMLQTNKRLAGTVAPSEVERAQLNFDRAQDMLRATKEIRDTRVKLLEQTLEQTLDQTDRSLQKRDQRLEDAMDYLEKDPDEPVLKAYCEELHEEILQLQAERERLQTILKALSGSPPDDSSDADASSDDQIGK
jgi:hypothetical protein